MRTSDLLLSSLNITEDEYRYKGQFILSTSDKARSVDMNDMEAEDRLKQIADFFGLDEDPADIRRILMGMIMEKADICSVIMEGEVS